MSTVMVPASAGEALDMFESAAGFLAGIDPSLLPDGEVARYLRVMERADAMAAAARGRLLQAFDARDIHLADGQRTMRAWLVHSLRVTRGQAAEYRAVQGLARDHEPLLAALGEGHAITTSVAVQLAKWTAAIPEEFREEAEQIVVAAARAGAGLRELAQICAEVRWLSFAWMHGRHPGRPGGNPAQGGRVRPPERDLRRGGVGAHPARARHRARPAARLDGRGHLQG